MDKVEEKISVEQGNKLIAEFMGAKKSTVDNDNRYLRFPEPHAGTKRYAFYIDYLKYNSSWNWLMPVIKKLNGGRPHSAMLWEDITKALIDCDIERTWLAVVEYIKWFYKKQ